MYSLSCCVCSCTYNLFYLSARKDSKGNLSLPDLPSKETPQVCDNKPTMEASVLLLITKSALSFFCNQLGPNFYRDQLVPVFLQPTGHKFLSQSTGPIFFAINWSQLFITINWSQFLQSAGPIFFKQCSISFHFHCLASEFTKDVLSFLQSTFLNEHSIRPHFYCI